MKKYEDLGKRYMEYISTSIISNGEKYYVIDDNKWDGEKYFNCFEIDKNLIDVINKNIEYIITPIYQKNGEDDFVIIDYEIN